MDSLELRRIRSDLIYVYKLLFGMVDADVPALFVANNVDTVTRGHSLKLFVQQSRIDAHKYFFSNRVIQSWNSFAWLRSMLSATVSVYIHRVTET